LIPLLQAVPTDDVIAGLEARKVPVGPVQTLDQVFGSDQVAARDMIATIPSGDAAAGEVRVIGNPLKLSKTPVTYRAAPPQFGADTERVLSKIQPKR
jgi:crotonobetainyl-CoA:carnitine CoA-transferase CaiB-like acyl-CoA transferase